MKRQEGTALLVFVMILLVASSFLILKALNTSHIGRDKITSAALAQAKEALIGWSIARGAAGVERPGELPCPDTNAPGSVNYGTQTIPCAAGAIGRLPWKTLGIEELKDASGETLWYAIDGAFRLRPTNNNPINSDTRAAMQVFDRDGVTLLTPTGSEAAAIIFSPGPALGGQSRATAGQTTAANYLDNTGPPVIPIARDNANTNGPFIQGGVQDANGNTVINDRLLIIAARDLMPAVERRVATELRTLLGSYFATNGFYPFPAIFSDPDCLDVGATGSSTGCDSDPTQCRGRLSDTEFTAPPAPAWFSYNLWGQVIYYAVGTNFLQLAPANCSATITINGTPGTPGLFIMPGTPQGAIVRNFPTQSIVLGDYLEDPTNQDGWTSIPPNTQINADSYVTPTAASNDRMQTLP